MINGKIIGTSLGYEDHGIMTFMITIEHAGGVQGFGGWTLDKYDKVNDKRFGTAQGMNLIAELLNTVGVSNWEDLRGKHLRFKRDQPQGPIDAIGHIIDDRWLRPKDIL